MMQLILKTLHVLFNNGVVFLPGDYKSDEKISFLGYINFKKVLYLRGFVKRAFMNLPGKKFKRLYFNTYTPYKSNNYLISIQKDPIIFPGWLSHKIGNPFLI